MLFLIRVFGAHGREKDTDATRQTEEGHVKKDQDDQKKEEERFPRATIALSSFSSPLLELLDSRWVVAGSTFDLGNFGWF